MTQTATGERAITESALVTSTASPSVTLETAILTFSAGDFVDNALVTEMIQAFKAKDNAKATALLNSQTKDKSNSEALAWLTRNKKWTDFLEQELKTKDPAILKKLNVHKATISRIDQEPYLLQVEGIYTNVKITLSQKHERTIRRQLPVLMEMRKLSHDVFTKLTLEHFPQLGHEKSQQQDPIVASTSTKSAKQKEKEADDLSTKITTPVVPARVEEKKDIPDRPAKPLEAQSTKIQVTPKVSPQGKKLVTPKEFQDEATRIQQQFKKHPTPQSMAPGMHDLRYIGTHEGNFLFAKFDERNQNPEVYSAISDNVEMKLQGRPVDKKSLQLGKEYQCGVSEQIQQQPKSQTAVVTPAIPSAIGKRSVTKPTLGKNQDAGKVEPTQPTSSIAASNASAEIKTSKKDDAITPSSVQYRAASKASSKQQPPTGEETASPILNAGANPLGELRTRRKKEKFFEHPVEGNPITNALKAAREEILTPNDLQPFSNLALCEMMKQCLDGMLPVVQEVNGKIDGALHAQIKQSGKNLQDRLQALNPHDSTAVKTLRQDMVTFYNGLFDQAVKATPIVSVQVTADPNGPKATGHALPSPLLKAAGALLTSQEFDDLAVPGAIDRASQIAVDERTKNDISPPINNKKLMEQRTTAVLVGEMSLLRKYERDVIEQRAEGDSGHTTAIAYARIHLPGTTNNKEEREGFEAMILAGSGGPDQQVAVSAAVRNMTPNSNFEFCEAPLAERHMPLTVPHILEKAEQGRYKFRTLDAEYKIVAALEKQIDNALAKRNLSPDDARGSVLLAVSAPFCASCAGAIDMLNNKYPNITFTPVTKMKTLHKSEVESWDRSETTLRESNRIFPNADGTTVHVDMMHYAEVMRKRLRDIQEISQKTGIPAKDIVLMRPEQFTDKNLSGPVKHFKNGILYAQLEGPRQGGKTIFVKGGKQELNITMVNGTQRAHVGPDANQQSQKKRGQGIG